jgi:hypothetical protein
MPTTAKHQAININRVAVVRLTDHGRRMLDAHYRELGLRVPVDIPGIFPAHDLYKGPLWDLMNIFGPCLYMGCTEVPFVKNEITSLPE